MESFLCYWHIRLCLSWEFKIRIVSRAFVHCGEDFLESWSTVCFGVEREMNPLVLQLLSAVISSQPEKHHLKFKSWSLSSCRKVIHQASLEGKGNMVSVVNLIPCLNQNEKGFEATHFTKILQALYSFLWRCCECSKLCLSSKFILFIYFSYLLESAPFQVR